jgi:hypothetical protein
MARRFGRFAARKSREYMKNASSDNWKELYIAALFEDDKTRLAEKITAAQIAIAARRRELLVLGSDSGTDSEDRRILDNAAFSLQALGECFSLGQRAAKAR